MRRIMADIAAESSQFVETPFADQKTIKIPEGDSANAGRCGVVGIGSNIRSQQSFNVEIEKSGQFIPLYRGQGSRFTIDMNYLRNADKEDITETNNPMGGERGNVIGLTQHPGWAGTTNEFDDTSIMYCIKMREITKWNDYDTDDGIIGLLGHSFILAGTVGIRFYALHEVEDMTDDYNYEWKYLSACVCGAADTDPQFDFVEMADGSLTLVVNEQTGASGEINCYRSFDMGLNWVEMTPIASGAVASLPWGVACERIGDRIVVAFTKPQAGQWDTYSVYSDDGGATWSSESTVCGAASGSAHSEMDMVRGQNGVLYLGIVNHNEAVNTIKSEDGINWTDSTGVAGAEVTAGVSSAGGFSMLQRYYGRWEMFAIDPDGGVDQSVLMWEMNTGAATSDVDPLHLFSVVAAVNQGVSIAAGAILAEQCCAREFNRGGFVDTAVITHIDQGGTDYYSFHILRTHMWSGVQLSGPNIVGGVKEDFLNVWVPNAHPGVADANPHYTHWTATRNGTGAYVMERLNNFHHLKLTADSGDESYYEVSLAADSYDAGVVIRTEFAVEGPSTGYGKVSVRLCKNDAPGNDIAFTFRVNANEYLLWDDNANAQVDIYTPTEAGMLSELTNFNDYLIVAIGDVVEIYRASSGQYREFQPYELILSVATGVLQDDGYAADNDVIRWGVHVLTLTPPSTSTTKWRSMMYKNSVDGNELGWNFASDMVGQRCHTNKIGIMQGMAVKFVGDWALDGDAWQIDTGAHFEGENIFIPSPRRCWKEPVQSAGSPDRVFTWERKDVDDQEMEYVFNAIAIFNTNTFFFKLEGENFGGGGAVTLFDSPTTNSANFCHSGRLVVSAINKNVITWSVGSSNWDTAPVPGQYASNEFRNWYIYIWDGAKTGQVYRILNNDGTRFILERSAEDDGVVTTDQFYVFSDRFFYVFDATQTYSRLTLTVQNGDVPYFPDNQCRVGTVVLGRTYDLDDDLWESSTSLEPNIKVNQSRAGSRNVEERGQERRSVSLGYTGLTDRGMGIEKAREFFRILRWGVRPVVWIDHDDVLDAVVSGLDCHSEPMLANVMGYNQSRKAYRQMTEFGDDHIRNYLDSGIKLEEVL